jgi:hypothetical protein
MALAGGARPDAMAVTMGSFDPETDWVTESGVFRAAISTGWAIQMAQGRARRNGDTAALATLAPDLGWQAHFATLVARPDLSHFARWCAPGGAGHDPAAALVGTNLGIPLLQLAGIADFLLRGTLAADRAFRAQAPDMTHLILAPWPHIPWAQTDATQSVDTAQIAFFDHYLKGAGPRPAPCRAHVAGPDHWAEHDPARLHAAPAHRLHLTSNGLAGPTVGDGRLTQSPPHPGHDIFVHDPIRPAPLIGGAAGQPSGPAERSALDTRTDVACYTTAPFSNAAHLFGQARLTLALDQSGPPCPIAASLSRICPSSTAQVLSTAVAAPGQPLIFDALSARIAKGEGLRLSLQPAPMPDYLLTRSPTLPAPATTPTTFTLHHAQSFLCLPLTQDAPDE